MRLPTLKLEKTIKPTLWVLFDSKDPDEDDSRSVTQHYQADCNSNQVRTLEFKYFEGHMGKGRLIQRSSRASNWETTVSMSILENLLDFMCDRYINRKIATGLASKHVLS